MFLRATAAGDSVSVRDHLRSDREKAVESDETAGGYDRKAAGRA